jgi:polyphosphate glucokinase
MPRQATRRPRRPSTAGDQPHTLAVDIGGSGLKASVLDASGRMMVDRIRIPTPDDVTPRQLVLLVGTLADQLPDYDRVSVGFPGVVRKGIVRTAPNLGTEVFAGFNLGAALTRKLGKPVRLANDADMQGYAAIVGRGVEMVITLGTGFGSALFDDGRLCPHMEFAHHPFRSGDTYEEQLGDEARRRIGNAHWGGRVDKAIETLRDLVNFDRLYLGGGNARRLRIRLPRDVRLVDNTAGILGGIRLWEDPGAAND